MNRFVLGVVALLVWDSLAQAQPRPVEKWEYAELRHYERLGKKGNDGIRVNLTQFISGAGVVDAHGWDDVVKKLNVPAAKKPEGEASAKSAYREHEFASRNRVMNHLGSQGWELVGTSKEEYTGCEVWIFKRRVP